MITPSFEQGPIRPPSEARSLLVRVIRNCTWNRCTFCPVYKGRAASQRTLEEILADVDAMAAAATVMASDEAGPAPLTAPGAVQSRAVPPEAFQVALFLQAGGRTVFLQDADPCAVRPEKLAAVIERVLERFPTVERVTTYGRARTLARRAPEQLRLLATAGLSRVHLGLESGADSVLRDIDKGCTAQDLIEAGVRVLDAGMELCFYLMPGIGGRAAAAEHVRGSAHVLRAVAAAAPVDNPLVVRLRTAAVVPDTPLAEKAASGAYELPDDVEVARELRDLLRELGDAPLELRSDHALNLLPELSGSLSTDRPRLLSLLDEYLELPEMEQAMFALGARLGIYRALGDRHDEGRRSLLLAQLGGARPSAREALDVARDLRSRFL